jgi:hypothetical protein
MKTALIALTLGLVLAAEPLAQSVWIRRPGPCRSAPGVVFVATGPSWRFVSSPPRVWRPLGWTSPRWWGPSVVFVRRPWGSTTSLSTSAPAWNPSPAIVPDPVVIPTAPLLTETAVRWKR